MSTRSETRAAGGRRPTPPKSMPRLREPRYSQSLERGLAILGCFSPDDPMLGIAELSESSG